MPSLSNIKKKYWLLIIAIAVIAMVASQMTFKRTFPIHTLTDINGTERTFINGDPLLVNIWATDCIGCVTEMPVLNQLHQKYQDKGFRVYAVALDYDKPQHIRNFIQRFNLTFPIFHDSDGQAVKKLGSIHAIPVSFLINGKGEIIKQSLGEPDWKDWEQEIQELLKH